jgi:FixJ family two-component response regulator
MERVNWILAGGLRYPADRIAKASCGRLLAKKLASLRCAMKVLYMPGYSDSSILRQGVTSGGKPFLQKPFTQAVLLGKVREPLAD